MPARTVFARIARFFRTLYLKLFRIHDTPQSIAIGLGLGVFSGVLPGTGPVAALALAFIFRVNRASALLGSIITNTWLSIPVFILSLKIGAVLAGLGHQELQAQWKAFLGDFHLQQLLSVSVYKIIGPILLGYFAVAACIGFLCYAVSFCVITYSRNKRILIWLSLSGVAVFFVLMRWHSLNLPLMRDEGEYAYAAWLLRHGIVPYRDAFLQKPPMIVFTYALAQAIGHAAYWAPKLLGSAFAACAMVLTGLVTRRSFGTAAGLVTMWLFAPMAMLPGAAQFTANVEGFMLLPMVAVLAIYVLKGPSASFRWWFLAGIFAGAAVMYKYTALPVMAYIIIVWAVDTWRSGREPRSLFYNGAAGALGAVLAIIAILAYFIAHNALSQVWECTVAFNKYYFEWNVFGGFGPFVSRLAEFLRHWWALFILTGYFIARHPRRWGFYTSLLALGVAVSCGSVYGHYYIVLMPFWAITAAAGLEIMSRDIARLSGGRVAIVRFAAVAAVLVSMHLFALPPFLRPAGGTEAEKFLKIGSCTESPDIARRIAAMTGERDYVFVAGSEPQILFYAARLSPTRFITMYPLMIPSPVALRYQEEAIRALEDHPPKAIVLAKHYDSWAHTEGSPSLILKYITKLLNSGDYVMEGGYVGRGGARYWKNSVGKVDLPASSLLLFRKNNGIL